MSAESEAAELLRRLLAEVDAGRLDADNPKGRGIVRQIEGAAVALEHVARGKTRRRGAGSRAPQVE